MSARTRLLVAIPTYNERENIPVLLELFGPLRQEFDFLFVDDNSPDGTADFLDSLGCSNIHVMRRPAKLGIGSAHRDAIRYAYERGYQRLATMDADLTHNPASLTLLLAQSEYADVVVGSRYLKRDSLPGWNVLRRSLTHLGHLMTSFFLKMPYDATGGLRIYNLQTIPGELFDLVRSQGYSFLYESLYILWSNGHSVVEVPISLPARTYGHSKMSFSQAAISALRLVVMYTNIRLAPDLYRRKSVPLPEANSLPESQWERYWGAASEDSAFDMSFEICATWFRRLLIRPHLERILRRFVEPGSKLLHAGCGSGHVDVGLRHEYQITGCDLSSAALRSYSQVNWPYCQVTQASIFEMPFEDGSFQGVYNLGVMEHFSQEEIVRALGEFHRILEPGGHLVMFWPPERSPMRYILGLFHAAASLFGKRATKQPLYPPEISRAKSKSQVQAWLEQSGFQLDYFEFSWRDLYTQYFVVARRGDGQSVQKGRE